MKPLHLIAAAGILIVVAGCEVARSGTPGPTEQPTSPSVTSSSHAPSSAVLPPRPRELDLAGVDPCTDLLTDEQLRELVYDLGYERSPRPDTSRIHGGSQCHYASSRPINETARDMKALVGISTSEGAEVWLTDPHRRGGDVATQATVEGFPALVLPHPDVTPNCLVVVDTADGQYLEMNASKASSRVGPSAEPYCAEAKRVAGMAIQTLSASR